MHTDQQAQAQVRATEIRLCTGVMKTPERRHYPIPLEVKMYPPLGAGSECERKVQVSPGYDRDIWGPVVPPLGEGALWKEHWEESWFGFEIK